MWNDIDMYHAVRDFTSDPVSFPADEMRKFVQELVRASTDDRALDANVSYQHANNQHCMVLLSDLFMRWC
jgi:hypothetical protein